MSHRDPTITIAGRHDGIHWTRGKRNDNRTIVAATACHQIAPTGASAQRVIEQRQQYAGRKARIRDRVRHVEPHLDVACAAERAQLSIGTRQFRLASHAGRCAGR